MTSLDRDLGEQPFDDDLETEPLAIPRRRRLPLLTAVLVLGVVAGGAFVGGAEAQKHWGSSGSSASRNAAAAFASRLRGGTTTTQGGAANGSRAGGFGGAGVTVGTVSVIKGSTLYVNDANGNTVKVTTSPTSDVTKTVSGSVKTIRPGDTVVVRGTQQRNGDISADSITIGTAGGGGFGSFGGGATGFGGGSGGATGFGSGGSGSGNSGSGGSGSGGSGSGGATGFGGGSGG